MGWGRGMAKHPCETFRRNSFERAVAFTGPLSTYFDPKPFREMQRSPSQAKKSQTKLNWSTTTMGGDIVRVVLAAAVAFCLAFPLSAGAASSECTPGQAICAQAVNYDFSAARRHRTVHIDPCPTKPDLTHQVCECETHGGWPHISGPFCFFGRCTPAVVACWPGENRQ